MTVDRILIALLIFVSAISALSALRGPDCITASQLLLPEGD